MAPPRAIGVCLRRRSPWKAERVPVLQAGNRLATTAARPGQIGQPPIIPADDLTFQSAAVQSRCRYLVRGDP